MAQFNFGFGDSQPAANIAPPPVQSTPQAQTPSASSGFDFKFGQPAGPIAGGNTSATSRFLSGGVNEVEDSATGLWNQLRHPIDTLENQVTSIPTKIKRNAGAATVSTGQAINEAKAGNYKDALLDAVTAGLHVAGIGDVTGGGVAPDRLSEFAQGAKTGGDFATPLGKTAADLAMIGATEGAGKVTGKLQAWKNADFTTPTEPVYEAEPPKPVSSAVTTETPFDDATLRKISGGKNLSQEARETLKEHIGETIPKGSSAEVQLLKAVKPTNDAISANGGALNDILENAPNFSSSVFDPRSDVNIPEAITGLKENLPGGVEENLSKAIDKEVSRAEKAIGTSTNPLEINDYIRDLDKRISSYTAPEDPLDTPANAADATRVLLRRTLRDKLNSEIPETEPINDVLSKNIELRSFLRQKFGAIADEEGGLAADTQARSEFRKGVEQLRVADRNADLKDTFEKDFARVKRAKALFKLVGTDVGLRLASLVIPGLGGVNPEIAAYILSKMGDAYGFAKDKISASGDLADPANDFSPEVAGRVKQLAQNRDVQEAHEEQTSLNAASEMLSPAQQSVLGKLKGAVSHLMHDESGYLELGGPTHRLTEAGAVEPIAENANTNNEAQPAAQAAPIQNGDVTVKDLADRYQKRADEAAKGARTNRAKDEAESLQRYAKVLKERAEAPPAEPKGLNENTTALHEANDRFQADKSDDNLMDLKQKASAYMDGMAQYLFGLQKDQNFGGGMKAVGFQGENSAILSEVESKNLADLDSALKKFDPAKAKITTLLSNVVENNLTDVKRSATSSRKGGFRYERPAMRAARLDGAVTDALNAGRISETDAKLFRRAEVENANQADIAKEVGVDQSTVSRRVQNILGKLFTHEDFLREFDEKDGLPHEGIHLHSEDPRAAEIAKGRVAAKEQAADYTTQLKDWEDSLTGTELNQYRRFGKTPADKPRPKK